MELTVAAGSILGILSISMIVVTLATAIAIRRRRR